MCVCVTGHVYNLCVSEGPITDEHASLQPFCQLLEVILRKGIKRMKLLLLLYADSVHVHVTCSDTVMECQERHGALALALSEKFPL